MSVTEYQFAVFEPLRHCFEKTVGFDVKALFARCPMSIRNKFETLVSLVTSDIDILMISETKIVESFPLSQFMIHGFSMLYRRDSGFSCISEITLL